MRVSPRRRSPQSPKRLTCSHSSFLLFSSSLLLLLSPPCIPPVLSRDLPLHCARSSKNKSIIEFQSTSDFIFSIFLYNQLLESIFCTFIQWLLQHLLTRPQRLPRGKSFMVMETLGTSLPALLLVHLDSRSMTRLLPPPLLVLLIVTVCSLFSLHLQLIVPPSIVF